MALNASSEEGSGTEKQNTENFGEKNSYDGFTPGDAEAQRNNSAYRRGSRIDRPVIQSISGSLGGRRASEGNVDEGDISVGKQLEAEAGNAIQYRTCSWQKV